MNFNIINKREAGCSDLEKYNFDEVKHAEWTEQTVVKGANGKPTIVPVTVTDPVKIQVFQKMAKAILSRCVYDTATCRFYIYRLTDQKWQSVMAKKEAITIMDSQLKINPPEGFDPRKGETAIPDSVIKMVMERAELFGVFGGDGFWPFGPALYQEAGCVVLNQFHDDGINPDLNVPLTPEQITMLEQFIGGIVRINLANKRGRKTLPELLQIINDKGNLAEYEFRYIMQNLAINYMRPGYNMQTNLALCGLPGGLGKNTVTMVLSKMLGDNLASMPRNPLSTFNDFAVNKTFVVLNEVEGQQYDHKFNQMIKFQTTEETVGVEGKHQQQKTVSNMANYWLLSNSIHPYKTDSIDRRTIFIRTFNDDDAIHEQNRQKFATDFNVRYKKSEVAEALAKFCHMIDLDFGIVNTYHQTELAKIVVESSGSKLESFIKNSKLDLFIHANTNRTWVVQKREMLCAYNEWLEDRGYRKTDETRMQAEARKMNVFRFDPRGRIFVNQKNLTAFRNNVPWNKDPSDYVNEADFQEEIVEAPTPESENQPVSEPEQITVAPDPAQKPEPEQKPTESAAINQKLAQLIAARDQQQRNEPLTPPAQNKQVDVLQTADSSIPMDMQPLPEAAQKRLAAVSRRAGHG